MRKAKAKPQVDDLKAFAAIDFEPCDREKFPVLSRPQFLAGMAQMGEVGYVAHILAFLNKPQFVQMLQKQKTTGEFERLVDDFKEVTATMKELLELIEKVELRILVAGCAMQQGDAA